MSARFVEIECVIVCPNRLGCNGHLRMVLRHKSCFGLTETFESFKLHEVFHKIYQHFNKCCFETHFAILHTILTSWKLEIIVHRVRLAFWVGILSLRRGRYLVQRRQDVPVTFPASSQILLELRQSSESQISDILQRFECIFILALSGLLWS